MLCFVFAALVVLLDQLFKRYIVLTLAIGENKELIPGLINLMHVENSGAAFSILPNQRWLLAAIAFVFAIVLIMILLRYNEGFWGTLGLAAVLGGTVGNLIDRVFHGYVVDMFRTTFMNFAIFNIADIFITVGGVTFCVFFIITSIKTTDEKEAEPEAVPETDEYDEGLYGAYEFPEELPEAQEPQEETDYAQLFITDAAQGDPNGPAHEPPPDMAPPPEVPEFGTPSPEMPEYFELRQEIRYESGQEPQAYYDPEQELPELIEPEPSVFRGSAVKPQKGASSTLDALGALESELTEMVDDYNLDDLLREYGFEDDKD